MDAEPRVALVTGGAAGIGCEIALRFGSEGYTVVIADLDESVVGVARAAVELVDARVDGVQADVSVPGDVDRLRRHVEDEYRRLDVLVNNAGGSAHTPLSFEDVTQAEFDRVMDWNVRSTFLMCQSFLDLLRRSGGSIINIASIAGRAGLPIVSVQYSGAKAAVIGMSRTLAAHVGPAGVRVNVVAPGFIRSGGRADEIWATRDEDRMLEAIPLRRRGEVDEIADVCLALASDGASYVTGAVIDVNGGYLSL